MKHKHVKIPCPFTLEVNCPGCGALNKHKLVEPDVRCYCGFWWSHWTGTSLNCFYCKKEFHWHKGLGVFPNRLSNKCYKPGRGINH